MVKVKKYGKLVGVIYLRSQAVILGICGIVGGIVLLLTGVGTAFAPFVIGLGATLLFAGISGKTPTRREVEALLKERLT